MSAIVALTDGVTAMVAGHANQYRNALLASLGITDDAQDALGRLELPRSSAAPGTPVQGQVYYDTDDKYGYVYNGSAWVPLRHVRQIIHLASVGSVALGTGYTDVLTQAITTTGGDILITAFLSWQGIKNGTSGVESVFGRIDEGGTPIHDMADGRYYFLTAPLAGGMVSFRRRVKAAGTYTYKLQAARGTTLASAGAIGGRCTLDLVEI